jgi:sugar phosphate isomerase/epimerase
MNLFAACIELTAAIQGKVLVYHCGVRHGTEDRDARAREVSALKALMPLAEKHGIMIGLENTNSGIKDLLHQIEAVGSNYLRLTLDLAHLYLAARAHDIDYLEAVRDAAPWVCHIHHNDNLGIQGKSDAYAVRIAYGETDLHLPLDWGAIPHAEAIAALGDYNGTWILEIGQRFRDHWSESLSAMKAYVSASV